MQSARQESIKREMEQTAADLSDKLESLNSIVEQKVDDTQAVIRQVRETVEVPMNMYHKTGDAIRSAPWQSVAGAVAAGAVLGYFTAERPHRRSRSYTSSSMTREMAEASAELPRRSSGPSWISQMLDNVRPEIERMSAPVLGAIGNAAREAISSRTPEAWQPHVRSVLSAVTESIEGVVHRAMERPSHSPQASSASDPVLAGNGHTKRFTEEDLETY
ncbi:MAG: hypothetical protein WD872_11700 [Pirellulaceae bacterium]